MQQLPDQTAGEGVDIVFTVRRAAGDVVNWSTAVCRFRVGIQRPNRRDWLATLTPTETMQATAEQVVVAFTVPAALTANLSVPRAGMRLVADAIVTPPAGEPYIEQAWWNLLPRVPDSPILSPSGTANAGNFGVILLEAIA